MAYSPTAQQPRFNYGGQAVIEGVMMRGSKALAVAVRDPKGHIVIHTEPVNASLYNGRISRTPFLRGLAMLWDSLGLGMRALMYSANVATGEVGVEFKGPIAWGTTAVALIIALLVFLLVPRGLSLLIEPTLGPFASAFLEGVIRLALFVGYIWLIGKMEDIRRVFAYHGAEHKTINAYEAGLDLSVPNVQRQTVQHPRCGTAFLLTVVVFSIFVFAPLNVLLPYGLGLIMRLALLPVVAMLAYEYIRFSARHLDNPIIHAITVPNLAMQKLTTREPDDTMVQVAIEALNKVLDAEQNRPLNPEYLIP
jgi:uncharacterized protein YqhQ